MKKTLIRSGLHAALAGAALFLVHAAARADDGETENWNAKFQSTYVWQAHSAFNAPYTGANSLKPAYEKAYSATATAAFGLRPWRGGEVYFDPEMVQASSFSNLHGFGGLPDAEDQKGGGTTPTFYTARLFLRQTWGFGGGKQKVESDMNQMAGSVDRHRLVLTAGRLSVADVFDNNSYAHDPRTQFMNVALTAYGPFDFAADTKGYSDGAAAEYYAGDWAWRFGRFAQPKVSNGEWLDYNLGRHYGDQVEIEHDHEIGGHPGKVRVLGFRNGANMGRFDDALAYAAAHGGAPDVASVRHDQSKYGGGVDVEQSLPGDVGVFARLGWNDGQTEAYAFAEVERSASAGAVVKGTRWNRPDDTAGLAVARNGLSAAHRAYLAAGGLGAFIGDGRIDYRPENIAEAYYSVGLNKHTWLTGDYQHINNPAYNADRGPVNVFAARLHVEY